MLAYRDNMPAATPKWVRELLAGSEAVALRPMVAGTLLVAATAPWIAPALRFLRVR